MAAMSIGATKLLHTVLQNGSTVKPVPLQPVKYAMVGANHQFSVKRK